MRIRQTTHALQLWATATIVVALAGCGSPPPDDTIVTPEVPSEAEYHAYKAYHHARYMVTTAAEAGGTNRLLNTRELPTEGSDPVVSPALDHLYSKAVLDLTEGPVYVEIPGEYGDRYWSIHITDQEHYTIFDEIRPAGRYVFVRKGRDMTVEEGATVIECPEDYPHLFIRIQVKNEEDMANTLAAQETITLTGASKPLEIDNYIEFTLATHDIYPENQGILESVIDFDDEDYARVTQYILGIAPTFPNNLGMFGSIDSTEPNSGDPAVRAAAIFGHLGLPAVHAIYFPNFVNCQGEVLNGDQAEVFTFAYEPVGVEEFWSITRYSAITRNTIPSKNDLFNAYNTTPDAEGDIPITFSVEDPMDGTYWMPVGAGDLYYFVVRHNKADLDNLPPNHCSAAGG
jgi:hypothetical protein